MIAVNSGKLITTSGKVVVTGDSFEQHNPRFLLSAELEVARYGYADGTAIQNVVDWTGNGFGFTQATSGNRATIQTNELNGYAVFRFDGTNDMYSSSFKDIWSDAVGCTVVHVYKRSGGAAANQAILTTAYGSGGGGMGLNITPSTTTSQISASSRIAVGGASASAPTPIGYDTNWHIVIGTVDVPTGRVKLFVDGVLVNSTTNTDTAASITSTNPTYVYFGASDTGAGVVQHWFNGDVAVSFPIEKCLKDQEVIQLYAFLKNKYAL